MQEVYITGHRNPDLDAVSSAWCYARLKNIVDPDFSYIPIRIGHLNETTRNQFQKIGVEPPQFVRDVRAKVGDVVTTEYISLHPEDPIYSLVTLMSRKHASVVPLMDGNRFAGLLSLDEITAFFLRENAGERPRYRFYPHNFSKVIRGEFIKKNDMKSFEAYIMTGAMEFDIYCNRLQSLMPELPVLVVGKRKHHLQYAIDNQFPAIILTGLAPDDSIDINLDSFKGVIYKSNEDTAETIRLLRMSLPLRRLAITQPPQVSVDDLFDDAKRLLMESQYRGLPVFDGDTFVGFVTRRCFLERPKRKMILVDHNELNQSVEGLEEAEIIEILDHHRLDAEKTQHPIFIVSEPVGSTCTIIYHQYLRWGVEIDPLTARMLLAGIVSDTVMLKSPTTTKQDMVAVDVLCEIASIPNVLEFGEELFSAASLLHKANPKHVIEGDFKTYVENSIRFGIGQVEVTTLEKVDEVKEEYLKQLKTTKRKYDLDWAMLLVTDVMKEDSILLTTPYPKREKALIYPLESDGKYILKGVLSRKKQLLPEIISVLKDGL
ncbi:MAG: putative manganese-dependent inorganic diphosphatase [Sphaerochaetaceae bacterium]|jgi:manganese-dependent inorganic pyrophosphatase|nr:putative manganese-dependent inorganic diphosphatase [Sphaerochaetaceae bacterium]